MSNIWTLMTRYVDLNSTNATPPFLDWSTAATNIQNAVDAAVAGDEILVTDGIYATGGRRMLDTTTNRVAVTKSVAIRSVNGPQATVIQGYQVPVSTNDTEAIRCVYLTNGASLSGFTLTKGATRSGDNGGGVKCVSATALVTNCVLAGNSAAFSGGGAYSGTLNNCTLIGNWATQRGGGAYNSTLNSCVLSNNSSRLSGGGGASDSTLTNCSLSNNSADRGGGTYYGTLRNCILASNSARVGGGASNGNLDNCILTNNLAFSSGGGADYATLNNCTLTGNSATNPALSVGGGAINSILNNCVLTRNWAAYQGGGAFNGTLNNCTLVTNSAVYGGGVYGTTISNSIVYYNSATIGSNYFPNATFNYACTLPKPNSGVGNITNTPSFIDQVDGDLRLQSNSPCINAGNNAYAPAGPDLDGNPRIVGGTVDMGAYECQTPALLDYYTWLQGFGLPTSAATAYADSDGEGMNNWQEWRADTIPTNALSVLQMITVTNATPGLQVKWQSVPTRNYWLDRATNLASPPSFSSGASNLTGQVGMTTYTDTNATGPGPFFYRVGVQP